MATGYLRLGQRRHDEVTASRVLTQLKVRADRSSGMGAGILFYAVDTGRFLIGKRSSTCEAPGTWANFGGGVEHPETPREGALREVWEEAGFRGPVSLELMHISKQPDFTYYNFLGRVAQEFVPKLNDEHTEHLWCKLEDFPDELHPKFAEALQSSSAMKTLLALGV